MTLRAGALRHYETFSRLILHSVQFEYSHLFNPFAFNSFVVRNLLFFSAEACMIAEDTVTSSYFVEISGWDKHESFFVERSQLASDDPSVRCISLRHNVSDGSLIFLRLLNHNTSLSAIPIAFEAHFLGVDQDGLHQFSISPAHPRQSASRFQVN